MSWKAQVIADSNGQWIDNAARFAARHEADAYAADLATRWTAVQDTRTLESEDPVNYRWVEGSGAETVSVVA